jgi:hypothetical protein
MELLLFIYFGVYFVFLYIFECLIISFFYLPFGAEDLPDLDFDPATAQLSNILYSKCL